MRVTVVTSKDDALVAVAYGEAPQPSASEGISASQNFRAGLLAGPGQKLQVIELADEALKIGDPSEFHQRVEAEFRKKRK